jgi:hypothetical protein
VKRPNPATGRPFELGDRRAKDHRRFLAYSIKRIRPDGYFVELWVDVPGYNLRTCLKDCRKTAVRHDLPFDIDIPYLLSIKTDRCPVFGTPFSWERIAEGYDNPAAPTLDKIKPELGYIKGNVIFISNKANRIKSNADDIEIQKVADWLREERKRVTDAFKDKPAPLPISVTGKSKVSPQLGFVFTTGAGQDGDNANDYRGATQGENSYRSAKEGSGDSVGYRSIEMESFVPVTRLENHGQPEPEVIRLEFGRRDLFD